MRYVYEQFDSDGDRDIYVADSLEELVHEVAKTHSGNYHLRYYHHGNLSKRESFTEEEQNKFLERLKVVKPQYDARSEAISALRRKKTSIEHDLQSFRNANRIAEKLWLPEYVSGMKEHNALIEAKFQKEIDSLNTEINALETIPVV